MGNGEPKYESNVPNVQGLSKLLLAVADKLEGDVDGLNKELLVQSAYRILRLEEVAWKAGAMIVDIPAKRKNGGGANSLVLREDVKALASLLKAAGYNVKHYV